MTTNTNFCTISFTRFNNFRETKQNILNYKLLNSYQLDQIIDLILNHTYLEESDSNNYSWITFTLSVTNIKNISLFNIYILIEKEIKYIKYINILYDI